MSRGTRLSATHTFNLLCSQDILLCKKLTEWASSHVLQPSTSDQSHVLSSLAQVALYEKDWLCQTTIYGKRSVGKFFMVFVVFDSLANLFLQIMTLLIGCVST